MSIFPLEQKFKTGNLDANLILRQCKLDLRSRFMEIKSINPKLTQKLKAEVLGYFNCPRKLNRNNKKLKILIDQKTPKELEIPQMIPEEL